MDFKEVIQIRRSIREYQADTTIEKTVIEEIIKDAQQAPSWKNSQTARYYVAVSPDVVAKLKAETLPTFNQNSSANAPVIVVTTFVKNVAGYTNGQPDNELGNEWGAYDLGLSNAYFALSAIEHGLDTLIMGIRNADAIREIMNIPENEQIAAVLALGDRQKNPKTPARKALEEVAKFF